MCQPGSKSGQVPRLGTPRVQFTATVRSIEKKAAPNFDLFLERDKPASQKVHRETLGVEFQYGVCGRERYLPQQTWEVLARGERFSPIIPNTFIFLFDESTHP